MKRDKDLITFELGAFNHRDGTFYVCEDGLHRLQLFVEKGEGLIRKNLSSKKNMVWIQQLIIEGKILRYAVEHSDSVICINMKVSTEYFQLMKEFDRLNKEMMK